VLHAFLLDLPAEARGLDRRPQRLRGLGQSVVHN
jgi:hypothetical protein